MYIRSTYTGQVYYVKEMPRFGGYEMVGRTEYLEWCAKNGMKPESGSTSSP